MIYETQQQTNIDNNIYFNFNTKHCKKLNIHMNKKLLQNSTDKKPSIECLRTFIKEQPIKLTCFQQIIECFNDLKVRVIRENNIDLVITKDVDENRLNIHVDNCYVVFIDNWQ